MALTAALRARANYHAGRADKLKTAPGDLPRGYFLRHRNRHHFGWRWRVVATRQAQQRYGCAHNAGFGADHRIAQ